ncbi:MAG: hypothetical protein ACK4J0_03245, partial [Candidatus Anstonellaceae archaeon]
VLTVARVIKNKDENRKGVLERVDSKSVFMKKVLAEQELVRNENVEKICEIFRNNEIKRTYNGTAIDIDSYYNKVYRELKKIEPSSMDIQEFVQNLEKFQDYKDFELMAGLFLSALINSSTDRIIHIDLRHLRYPLDFVGYENKKEVYIIGDVGNFLGYFMSKGRITLIGNVGIEVGKKMNGGEIYISKEVIYISREIWKAKIYRYDTMDLDIGRDNLEALIKK